METWKKVSIILCTYGFFHDFRPSEPFVTEFLTEENGRNFTSEIITQHVYPWGTYSYLVLLVIVFLITDMLRYKPLIILSATVGCVIWSMLLWTESLEALQGVQVLYGTYMATEVAYYTYIYAKVDRDRFQVVTGFTKSATLSGRFCAGVIAQLFFSFNVLNLRELNYLTLASQFMSLIWAFLLPAVSVSLYFYARTDDQIDDEEKSNQNESVMGKLVKTEFSAKRAVRILWSHFRDSYTNFKVIQWSIWWSLAMCGFMQVQSYVQLLWLVVDPNHTNVYNGAVEAALTLFGAGGAFTAGYINNRHFDRWDLWILTGCSALEGGLLYWGAITKTIWLSYLAYILFGVIYHFMITVASVNIAKRLNDDSFGLIFGINTLLALAFQSILTVVVISDSGFALAPIEQFLVYGSYFGGLAIVFGLASIISMIVKSNRQ